MNPYVIGFAILFCLGLFGSQMWQLNSCEKAKLKAERTVSVKEVEAVGLVGAIDKQNNSVEKMKTESTVISAKANAAVLSVELETVKAVSILSKTEKQGPEAMNKWLSEQFL